MPRRLQWGDPQPNRPRQAAADSERGQSQPSRRRVRCAGERVFWRHCHCRGTKSRPRLIWPLRTQVRTRQFSWSRALGPMLTASARALWPFFVRFSAPSPAWRIGRSRGRSLPAGHRHSRSINLPLVTVADVYIHYSCPAADSHVRRRLSQNGACIQRTVAGSNPADADGLPDHFSPAHDTEWEECCPARGELNAPRARAHIAC